jgi:hypothetical protein
MKKTHGLIICSFVFLLLATSCQKSGTGPEGGVKGDPGATGPAGLTGAGGAAGAGGPAGSANVIYSAWFTASPWIKDTVFYVYGFNYTKAVTEITQDILDSGTVITFGKLSGYNTAI